MRSKVRTPLKNGPPPEYHEKISIRRRQKMGTFILMKRQKKADVARNKYKQIFTVILREFYSILLVLARARVLKFIL